MTFYLKRTIIFLLQEGVFRRRRGCIVGCIPQEAQSQETSIATHIRSGIITVFGAS